MKKLILAALVASSILLSCKGQDKPADGEEPKASKKDVSYAFGVAIGNSLKEANVTLDYSSFLKGIKDVLDKDKPSMDISKAQELIQTAVMEAQDKKNADLAQKEVLGRERQEGRGQDYGERPSVRSSFRGLR